MLAIPSRDMGRYFAFGDLARQRANFSLIGRRLVIATGRLGC